MRVAHLLPAMTGVFVTRIPCSPCCPARACDFTSLVFSGRMPPCCAIAASFAGERAVLDIVDLQHRVRLPISSLHVRRIVHAGQLHQNLVSALLPSVLLHRGSVKPSLVDAVRDRIDRLRFTVSVFSDSRSVGFSFI